MTRRVGFYITLTADGMYADEQGGLDDFDPAEEEHRYANNLEEEIEKVKYDLYYVKYRSHWLDVRIVFQTLRLCFTGGGTAALEPQARPATAPLKTAGSLRVHG